MKVKWQNWSQNVISMSTLQLTPNKYWNSIPNLQKIAKYTDIESKKQKRHSSTRSFHQIINLSKWTAKMCAFCLCLLIVIHYWSIFNSTLHHSLWHTCQISEGGKHSGADRLYHSAVQWLQGSAPISDVISTIDLLRQKKKKIFRVFRQETHKWRGTPFLRRYKSARVHSARTLNATHPWARGGERLLRTRRARDGCISEQIC